MKRVIEGIMFIAVVFLVADMMTPEEARAQIKIHGGTYGENCGAPYGNRTRDLANACENKPSCRYGVDPHPDPCYGTKKTFYADYSCLPSTARLRQSLEAEALGKPLVLACEVAGLPPGSPLIATVRAVRGEVVFAVLNSDWVQVKPGQQLFKGDAISTGLDSQVELVFTEGATITLREMSEISIGQLATSAGRAQAQVLMKLGEITSKIIPQRAVRSDFGIKTPTATISVRGTIFTVRHDSKTQITTVSVEEGEVLVTPTNTSLPPFVLGARRQVDVAWASRGPIRLLAAAPPPTGVAPPGEPAGSSPPPSAGGFGWVHVGVGDCTGHDIGQTLGSASPNAGQCHAGTVGTIAVCWDGKQYANGGPREWCTYKSQAARPCGGGSRPGFGYECRLASAATAPAVGPGTCQYVRPAQPVFSANQQVFVWQGLPPTVTWFALGEQSLPNHWYQTLWAGISDGSRGQQVFPSASNSSKLNPGNYVVRSFNANNQIVGECPFSVR